MSGPALRRVHGGNQVSGFGRIVLLGAIVATVAGIAGLRAQTQLGDPRDAPRIFASTCSACHKSPQGLAKSGQVAGFLRQHYTTGPEMSAAMAAYLVAAGSAPRPRRIGKGRRAGQSADPAAKAKTKKQEQLPRPSRGADAQGAAHAARQAARRSRKTSRGADPQPAHPAPVQPAVGDRCGSAAEATAAAPAAAEQQAATPAPSRTAAGRARYPACRRCRRRRRPISLSRSSRPRRLP